MRRPAAAVAFVLLLGLADPANAGIVMYSNAQQIDFLAQVQPGALQVTNVGSAGARENPLVFTSANFGVSITDLYNYAIYVHQNIIHTFGTYDNLGITFSKPTTAFGASFGVTNDCGELQNNYYTWVVATTAGGATAYSYAGSAIPFLGFLATEGDTLTSVVAYKADADLGRYVAIVPTITVGSAVSAIPEPSGLAIWSIGLCGFVATAARSMRGARGNVTPRAHSS